MRLRCRGTHSINCTQLCSQIQQINETRLDAAASRSKTVTCPTDLHLPNETYNLNSRPQQYAVHYILCEWYFFDHFCLRHIRALKATLSKSKMISYKNKKTVHKLTV